MTRKNHGPKANQERRSGIHRERLAREVGDEQSASTGHQEVASVPAARPTLPVPIPSLPPARQLDRLQTAARVHLEALFQMHAPSIIEEVITLVREWGGHEDALYAREWARYTTAPDWEIGSKLRRSYFRLRVSSLFSQLSPVSVTDVESLLDHHRGQEDQLCRMLAEKYGLEDSIEGPPGHNLPRDSDYPAWPQPRQEGETRPEPIAAGRLEAELVASLGLHTGDSSSSSGPLAPARKRAKHTVYVGPPSAVPRPAGLQPADLGSKSHVGAK